MARHSPPAHRRRRPRKPARRFGRRGPAAGPHGDPSRRPFRASGDESCLGVSVVLAAAMFDGRRRKPIRAVCAAARFLLGRSCARAGLALPQGRQATGTGAMETTYDSPDRDAR